MTGKGSDLAARFQAAFDRDAQRQTEEEREQRRHIEASRAAREDLFRQLREFALQLPFLQVAVRDEGVALRFGDRELRFIAEGDAEVSVTFSEQAERDVHRIYREPALQDRWIWVRTRGRREDRLPLFDQGLQVLLVHALQLPDPDDTAAEPEPVGRPTPSGERKL